MSRLGAVIAGGRSSRFGSDKAMALWQGRPLIDHAIDRLVMNAQLMGADAVVMMRFDSGSIGQTMNEVVAYGTAIRIERA